MRRLGCLALLLLLVGCAGEDPSVPLQPGIARSLHSTMRRTLYADAANGCLARRVPGAPTVDTVTWSGACASGLADGEGLMRWYRHGDLLETEDGTFHAGLMEGEGTQVLESGTRYSGQWHAGLKEGSGSAIWYDGGAYVGDWRNDRLNGTGTMRSAAGQVYRGHWQDDERNGEGVQTWPSGNRYEGGWRDNKRDGKGTFTWADGSHFEGEWRDGEPQSQGSLFVDTDGTRYENWDYRE